MSATAKDTDEGVTELMLAIADLSLAFQNGAINKLAGAWSHRWKDERGSEWAVAVNGHKAPVADPFNEGSTIPFCHAHLYFNGWPFGIVTPFSGISGNGAIANEDSCLAAIRAETTRIKERVKGSCVHGQLLRFLRTEDDNDWCDACDGPRAASGGTTPQGANNAK